MLKQEEFMEVKILAKQGMGIKEIARSMGIARNTVRKYLRAKEEPIYLKREKKASKLDHYKNYLIERIEQAKPFEIPSTVLFREIKEEGYGGGMTILREFVRVYRRKEEGLKKIRFETAPGEQMQADWTWISKGENPLGAFVAILGYSRKAFVEFVVNEQEETLLSCHIHAFDYFGGVPKTILYDNMKTVVTQRNKFGEGRHSFQKVFCDFAKHYGFVPKLCRPYRPQTKGKVERFNAYLKNNFYYPLVTKLRDKADCQLLNREVKKWLKEIADKRQIKELGKMPEELFEEEKLHLQSTAPVYVLFGRDLKPYMDIKVMQHSLEMYEALGRFA